MSIIKASDRKGPTQEPPRKPLSKDKAEKIQKAIEEQKSAEKGPVLPRPVLSEPAKPKSSPPPWFTMTSIAKLKSKVGIRRAEKEKQNRA